MVPSCRGRRGHPVLMDGRLIPALLAEPLDSSLGRFIRRRGCVTVEVDDPGIYTDLDERNDKIKIDALLRAECSHE